MNQPRVNFQMILVVPDGEFSKLTMERAQLHPENQRELVSEFTSLLKHDAYGFNFKAGEEGQPAYVLHFKWHGTTAGTGIWAEDDPQGNVTDLFGVSVMLLGIDPAEDQKALEYAQAMNPMRAINPSRFEMAKQAKRPTAAHFFVNAKSANNVELKAIIELFVTAFLNQFAVGLNP